MESSDADVRQRVEQAPGEADREGSMGLGVDGGTFETVAGISQQPVVVRLLERFRQENRTLRQARHLVGRHICRRQRRAQLLDQLREDAPPFRIERPRIP